MVFFIGIYFLLADSDKFILSCKFIFEMPQTTIAGEHPLPSVRIDETVYVLQELARLSIHSDAAAVLQVPQSVREILKKNNNIGRAHLYVLFPSFCELVVSRFVPQCSFCFLTIFLIIFPSVGFFYLEEFFMYSYKMSKYTLNMQMSILIPADFIYI